MIRAAQEKDLQEILEIYNDALMHTTAVYDYTPHTLEQRRQWFKQKRESGHPVLVYEDDGRIAGYAAYGPFRSFQAYQYTAEHSVYVHKNFRNRGIGEQLLRAAIELATEQQYKTLVAAIDSANEPSIRLHEKLGFKHAGTIHQAAFKFGKWLDLVFYQLGLPGPAEPKE